MGLIRFYQLVSSPFPSPCRYSPSCSNYAIEAVRVHGAIRGGVMGIWRILRCNPFSRGGSDPVPKKR